MRLDDEIEYVFGQVALPKEQVDRFRIRIKWMQKRAQVLEDLVSVLRKALDDESCEQ